MKNKTCIKCNKEKSILEFHARCDSPDGRQGSCKKCRNLYLRNRYRENPGSQKASSEKWREKNPERVCEVALLWGKNNAERKKAAIKSWQLANKERVAKNAKKWAFMNKDKKVYYVRNRQAKKINATPIWANHESIRSIYSLASFLTLATFGRGYHVDHIIPLKSKIVCGLHLESNLQILKAEDNLKKGNRYSHD